MLSYSWVRATLLVLLTALILVGVPACGTKRGTTVRVRKLLGGDIHLRTRIAPNANMNTPVAVEFVLVYDAKLLEVLAKTNAKDWFMNREQFRQDNPKGFDSWYWEWIPGQRVQDETLPLKPSAKAALVYADYVVPGDNRARLDPYKDTTINLGERTFTATQ